MTSIISNLIKKNEKKHNSSEPDIIATTHDFVPYACHYDADTILTKNGELLQVIKITGFSSEAVGSEKLDLREVIREAVGNTKTENFAFWINTVRRKKDLDPGGDFPVGFSDDLNKAWKSVHGWNESYVNEVYITVIRSGTLARISEFSVFLRSLYFGFLKTSQRKFLQSSKKELAQLVNTMLKVLQPFGSKRLSIYESKGVFYSEQLQFFYKILNFSELPIKVTAERVADSILNDGLVIGYNNMQIRTKSGKMFGAAFITKEYYEIPGEGLDRFLQLPQEFIITQTLDFIDNKKATKELSYQRWLLTVGKDEELAYLTGLDAVVSSDAGRSTDFGESQITIFVINNTLAGLEADVTAMTTALDEIGVFAPRVDLWLEDCFWMQLPCNFVYIKKQMPIATRFIGGYASLFNYPAGMRLGNHWGVAVTMFRTANKTPLFFNFHVGDNGHTAIIGPKGMGKTVMTNFLVSEARKFKGRVFFFDQENASQVFIKSIGGYYTNIDPHKPASEYAFNPLNIPDNPENREFLKEWIVLLVTSQGEEVTKSEESYLHKLIDYTYDKLPQGERRLSNLARLFADDNLENLARKMSIWQGTGKYAHLFDNNRKGIVDFSSMIYGFSFSDIVKDGITLGPVLSYLFHRIEMLLDGIPTIIVLDEAWSLVNNDIFAPKLESWLERLRNKNAIVIFVTETIPDNSVNSVTQTITSNIATKIFLPNPDADDSSRAYMNVWGLSRSEFANLIKIRGEKREFMLKQKERAIVIVLELSNLKEVKILSGDDKTVIMMNNSIEQMGEDSREWLPVLYAKMDV
jgi:type IV secretion system protein VirB4